MQSTDMSNPKSNRLTRDFIKQVVHFYNKYRVEDQLTTLHTCKVCSHKWVGDLEKTQCPKCSEKEIIIQND